MGDNQVIMGSPSLMIPATENQPDGIKCRELGPAKFGITYFEGDKEHIVEYPWMLYVPQWYQRPYHESKKRILIALFANKTGKTFMPTWHFTTAGEGHNPYINGPFKIGGQEKKPPLYMAVSVTSMGKMDEYMRRRLEAWMTKIDGILEWQFYRERMCYVHKRNGSQIDLKSDEEGERAFEAQTYDLILLDELHSREVTMAARWRLLGGEQGTGQLWICGTGLFNAEWLAEEWIRPHDEEGKLAHILTTLEATGRHFLTIYDNKKLDQETLAEVEQDATGWEREVRVLGKIVPRGQHPVFDTGRLYRMFETAQKGERGRIIEIQGVPKIPDPMDARDFENIPAREKIFEFSNDANGPIEFWQKKLYGERYIIVGDPSGGTEHDEGVWQVYREYTCDQVAEWASNKTSMPDYCDIGVKMGMYYNEAKMVILRKGVGEGVVDTIKEVHGYKNLHYDAGEKRAGWVESEGRNEQVVARFMTLLRNDRTGLRSKRCIEQAINYQRDEKGRLPKSTEKGPKRDRLVAAMVALMFCNETGRKVIQADEHIGHRAYRLKMLQKRGVEPGMDLCRPNPLFKATVPY